LDLPERESKIIFRDARAEDVVAIAYLQFKHSLLSVLGVKFLVDLYSVMFRLEPNGFCVAMEGEQLVGFAIGTTDSRKLATRTVIRLIFPFLRGISTRRYAPSRRAGLRRALGLIAQALAYMLRVGRMARAPSPAELLAIAVRHDYQRRSIAIGLVEAVCEYMRRQGVRVITLSVFASNTGAIMLYKKSGFHSVAEVDKFFGKLLLMSKDIQAEAKHG